MENLMEIELHENALNYDPALPELSNAAARVRKQKTTLVAGVQRTASLRLLTLNYSCRRGSICNVENPWKRPIIAANALKLLGSNSLGKGEVHSSILCGSTIKAHRI
jgi:hypothetical protein